MVESCSTFRVRVGPDGSLTKICIFSDNFIMLVSGIFFKYHVLIIARLKKYSPLNHQ